MHARAASLSLLSLPTQCRTPDPRAEPERVHGVLHRLIHLLIQGLPSALPIRQPDQSMDRALDTP